MRCVSTRGEAPSASIDAALQAGLAADGGLYVPDHIPALIAPPAPDTDLAETASTVLAPYFIESALHATLPALCRHAFDVPAPLRALHGAGDHLLELFHGPTAAFKDYAARFLARALQALRPADAPPVTIVVATSGDTGAAVAAAFHRLPGFAVAILYPDGRVSQRQAHGLECWDDNVRTFRVAGSFDDCQRMAKQLLADAELRERLPLGSANSISLGRLLPQIAYHAHAAWRFHRAHDQPLNLIVPTGNLGNACAAWLARRMGAPVGRIVLATNANAVLPRFLAGGDYRPQPAIATLANAMDVGDPSNVERLRHWHGGDDAALRSDLQAMSVDDRAIRAIIAEASQRHGIIPCPHTACGLFVLQRLRAGGDRQPWAVVATAHPAKFADTVEPLLGHAIPVPPALQRCLSRPRRFEQMPAEARALQDALLRG